MRFDGGSPRYVTVKNPSIFVKKMEFVRDYAIQDGTSLLKRMETKTETRLVGRAELNIDYGNFRRESEATDAATDEARPAH